MSTEFESLDTVLHDFNDIETPPDLTVRPARTALVVRMFRQMLMSEQALARRADLLQLEAGARREGEDCLHSKNARGAAYCLGNLALLLKIGGDRDGALKSAEEAQRLASETGLGDLAEALRATLDSLRRPTNGA